MANEPFVPWSFLALHSSPSNAPPFLKKSFAQAVSNSFDIVLIQLPNSCFKGNELAIKISESEYQAGVQECKNILHGRLILSKGNPPLKLNDLCSKLLKIWNPIGSWTIVSLGKGFYEFNFSSLEDQRMIRSSGSCNLSPGVLRLSSWTPDFNPNSIRQTHAQCWVRFHGLSREYWRPKIFFEIGGGIGVPIALDEATMKRSFGHFARILIEIGPGPSEFVDSFSIWAFWVGGTITKYGLKC